MEKYYEFVMELLENYYEGDETVDRNTFDMIFEQIKGKNLLYLEVCKLILNKADDIFDSIK